MKTQSFKWFLFLIPLLFLSCGSESDWAKALNETAPPNPQDAIAKRSTSQDEVSGEGGDIEDTEEIEDDIGTSDEQGTAGGPLQPDAGKATLNIILLNYPECYKGAVRLFVDGKIIGLFDNEGKLKVSVEPGQRHLDIWDSGGRWTVDVTAPAGASLDIEIACDDRRSYEDA